MSVCHCTLPPTACKNCSNNNEVEELPLYDILGSYYVDNTILGTIIDKDMSEKGIDRGSFAKYVE